MFGIGKHRESGISKPATNLERFFAMALVPALPPNTHLSTFIAKKVEQK